MVRTYYWAKIMPQVRRIKEMRYLLPIDDKKKDELKKFIKFAVTGGLNTAVDFAVFTLLDFLGVGTLISQAAGYSAGILNSYCINRRWTFNTSEKFFSPQMIKFIAVNAALMLLSVGLMYVLCYNLSINRYIAKLMCTAVTVCLGFIINRLWVF